MWPGESRVKHGTVFPVLIPHHPHSGRRLPVRSGESPCIAPQGSFPRHQRGAAALHGERRGREGGRLPGHPAAVLEVRECPASRSESAVV